MKIHEYQAKEVLASYGVPTPTGFPAFSADEVARLRRLSIPDVVKARRRVVQQLKARGGRVRVDKAGRVVSVRFTDRPIETPDLDLPAAYVGVYKERQRGAGYALYESLGIERSDFGRRAEQMLRNFSFFGAWWRRCCWRVREGRPSTWRTRIFACCLGSRTTRVPMKSCGD